MLDMKITTMHTRPIVFFLLALLLVTACSPQTPILIYVTPTPAVEATLEDTVVPPTETELPISTPVPTLEPEPTDTLVQPDRPTSPPIGPVIGPDYTPPPTSTPRPTMTPTPGTPTGTPGTPTVAPTSPVDPDTIPALDGREIGVQVHSLLDQDGWDEVLADVERLGIGWVKVQIDWSLLQPNAPGEISEDFRRQELYLESLNQRGLNVLISVAKAPDWARSTDVEAGPPDDPQALADFISLMLREFGNVIDAVEVWNEPNLQREWQGQPLNGASYMRYFDAAYRAIRAYSPDIVVITGGPAPTSNLGFSVDDREYLRQMYAAGLGNYSDVAIGVHPYSWGNAPDARCCETGTERGWNDDPHFFFADTVADYREIMVANGHADLKMWVTEFGWATWEDLPGDAPEEWMTYNDRWLQGQYTLRALQIGQQTDYIGPMFLWNLNFAMLPGLIENRDERAAYGLIVPRQPRERPLYWMLFDAVRPDIRLERYD
jgi:hypothetical protein